MKKSLISFIMCFIISFFVTIGYKAYNTVVTVSKEVDDEVWAAFACPYDIKEEYLDSRLYTNFRKRLMKRGFDDTNIISNYLKKKQLESFEAAKKKIPADDALIDGFWYSYKYEPKLQNKKETTTLEEFLELREIAKNLANKKSKSTEFQNQDKYITISHIADYLSEPQNIIKLYELDKANYEDFNSFVCSIPFSINQSIVRDIVDVSYFLSNDACLRMLIGIFYVARSAGSIECNAPLLKNTSYMVNNINAHLTPEKLAVLKKDLLVTIEGYEGTEKVYREWIMKNCPNKEQVKIN